MPFTVTMPKMSPTMEEGTIAKWRKKEGDLVKSGEVLIDVATDKATVEYEALDDGYLRKILVPEGGHAKINDPIAIFTADQNESIEGYEVPGVSPAKEEPKAEKAAKPAQKDEESNAPAEQAPAAASRAEPKFVPEPPLEGVHYKKGRSDVQNRILASPLARKLAQEKGVDIASVRGSGPNGRVMSRDLETASPAAVFTRKDAPKEVAGSYEEIPMSPMRKVVGKRLGESKTFIPHFYITQKVDATSLVEVREQLKKFGVSLTYNDFVVKACALALREMPEINSGYHSENQSIIRFKTVDISIAVTVEGGLITPIVRFADYKDIGELASEIKQLAKKARDNELKPEEYKGGSFTVSNLGMFGVSNFKAIINPPQAAILAVGGISDEPVVKNGMVVSGKVMEITLSCDHRIIDGSEGAKFIKTVQKYLESPSVLIL